MGKKEFFPQRPKANPTIYAYTLPNDKSHEGQLKIGFTIRSAQLRIEEQKNAKFVKITASGMQESHPHSITITKEAPNYSRR